MASISLEFVKAQHDRLVKSKKVQQAFQETLDKYTKERSGFVPFYSNDINHYICKPVEMWDKWEVFFLIDMWWDWWQLIDPITRKYLNWYGAGKGELMLIPENWTSENMWKFAEYEEE